MISVSLGRSLAHSLLRISLVRAFLISLFILAVGLSTHANGSTIVVPSGGNLQAVINFAQCGDRRVLQAGATYQGKYALTEEAGPNVEIYELLRFTLRRALDLLFLIVMLVSVYLAALLKSYFVKQYEQIGKPKRKTRRKVRDGDNEELQNSQERHK